MTHGARFPLDLTGHDVGYVGVTCYVNLFNRLIQCDGEEITGNVMIVLVMLILGGRIGW